MATITQVQNQIHNAEGLLGIVNPDRGRWTCVGYAPSQHRRCRNPAALHNRTAADVLLRSLAHGTRTDVQLRQTLHEIAGYLICRRFDHQDQAAFVAAQWHAIIRANVPLQIAQGPTITLVNPTHNPAPIHHPAPVPHPAPVHHLAPTHNPAPVHNPASAHNSGPSSVDVIPEPRNDGAAQGSADRNRHEARDGNAPRGRTNEQITEQSPEAHHSGAEQARPSRSAVRRARETFIADLEAQQRSRREVEAESERVRQEAEARRLAEEERIRQEAAVRERAERQRVEQEQARQQAEARERAERLRLEQVRVEQRRVEREQAIQECEAREHLRQRIARREQEVVAAAEREVRASAEQEQSQRHEAWATYERDWDNMSRINTFELDEEIKESVPWPVRSGQWQDVSPANVRRFFRNAPPGQSSDSSQFRSLLRQQMWRWHEDRIQRSFPRIADNAEALALAVVVMQVLNAMVEDIRHV